MSFRASVVSSIVRLFWDTDSDPKASSTGSVVFLSFLSQFLHELAES